MKSGSLFTGTAALDMAAAEIFGAQPAWCADLDPGAAALLKHHHPDVPNLGDITKVDWDLVAALAWVYVLTLGWPCQPWSLAGKRKGADDERALWPECERAIRALRPRYLLLENVPAVVAAGELERVATSLATLGYRFAWCCLRASAVGAPHRRERFFLVAVAEDADGAAGGERRLAAPGQAEGGWARADARGRGRAPAAHAGRDARSEDDPHRAAAPGRGRAAADADGGRLPRNQERDIRTEGGLEAPQRDDADRRRVRHGASVLGSETTAAEPGTRNVDWAGYGHAISRWEQVTERRAPAPTVLSEQYQRMLRRRLAGLDRRPVGMRGSLRKVYVLNPALPEWMMGLPDGWITAVPGLSRSAQLKLAGNGVVKQQAVAAYRYLLDVLDKDARTAA